MKIFLFLILLSCDPAIFIPQDPLAIQEVNKQELKTSFNKIVVRPIVMNFKDGDLKNELNKIIIKNIQNHSNLEIFFDNENNRFKSLESYTIEVRVIKSENFDLEFRLFNNKDDILVYKKVLSDIKQRKLIIESEKNLKKIFKNKLKKINITNYMNLKNKGVDYAQYPSKNFK